MEGWGHLKGKRGTGRALKLWLHIPISTDLLPPLQRKVGVPWLRDCSVQSNEVPRATWISNPRRQRSGGDALDLGLLSQPMILHPN